MVKAKEEQGKQKFIGTAGLQEAGTGASTGYSSSRKRQDHGPSGSKEAREDAE